MDKQDILDYLDAEVHPLVSPDHYYVYSNLHDMVSELPTVNPVRHGKWVESDTDGFVCSECHSGYRDQPTCMGRPMFEYCPICGAKMDE